MKKIIVVYKTEGRKGIRLTLPDIEMLLFLYEQSFLTQQQLYQFYSAYFTNSKQPLYDTFKKRAKKFEQLDLIKVYKYHMKERKNGVRFNIFQLTEKGYRLLVHSGFLKDEPYLPTLVNKWDRILAAKEVISNIVQSELKEHGVLQSYITNHLFLANPTKSKFLNKIDDTHINYPIKPIVLHSEDLLNSDKMFHVKQNFGLLPTKDVALSIKRQGTDGPTLDHIEPDWLFQMNNQFLIVEIDLGYRTQNRKRNTNAYQISIIQALETLIKNIPKGIPINILYIHVDNSFPFRRIYSDHTKRISIMKTQLDSLLIENPLVSIYTGTLNRKETIIETVLEAIWGYQDNDLIPEFFSVFKQGIEPHEIIRREVHLLTQKNLQEFPLIEYFDDLEHCILVKEKEVLTVRKKYYLPFFIREGSLSDQYRLSVYSNRLKEYKKHLDYTDTIKILAIYPNEDEFKHDLHRTDLALEEIIFCSLDNLPVPLILDTHSNRKEAISGR